VRASPVEHDLSWCYLQTNTTSTCQCMVSAPLWDRITMLSCLGMNHAHVGLTPSETSMDIREGMRRLGIVLGIIGFALATLYSFSIAREVHDSAIKGVLKESLLVDYAVLLALPVLGFLAPWGTIRVLVWILGGFSK
jgi:hypothetical protein